MHDINDIKPCRKRYQYYNNYLFYYGFHWKQLIELKDK